MTELEAVNYLLDAIGATGVNSLTLGHPAVDSARIRLEQATRRVQQKGLWFNKDYNVTLSPEAVTKRILLQDVRSVQTNNRVWVQRGKYLYNRLAQTYQFEEDVCIPILIRYITFEDMPDIAQDVAVYQAAAEFVGHELGDPNKVQAERQLEAGAKIELHAEHLRNEQFNVFDNPRIRRARSGVRPYGSHARDRFYGTPDR